MCGVVISIAMAQPACHDVQDMSSKKEKLKRFLSSTAWCLHAISNGTRGISSSLPIKMPFIFSLRAG
jgi:hypothetical protein